jgi:hypothetical protein
MTQRGQPVTTFDHCGAKTNSPADPLQLRITIRLLGLDEHVGSKAALVPLRLRCEPRQRSERRVGENMQRVGVEIVAVAQQSQLLGGNAL